jgi:F420-non-reducing hydrogenase iron-sulfur subunit
VENGSYIPKILVLATERCAYPGADAVGKAHLEYGANTYILRVPSPALFPEDFYLHAWSRGVDGILIAACGSDCPYRGAYDRLARRIDEMTIRMKDGGLETQRIRLTAICTVCIKAFLKEVSLLNEALAAIGPVNRVLAAQLAAESRARLQSAVLPGAA